MDTQAKLEYYYQVIYDTVLRYQNEVTGLIPSVEGSNHAWIRENTYAVMCMWGLALAYRKIPDSQEERSHNHELECRVVKVLRGLLSCLMRQSDKVQSFKLSQSTSDSLHAKFNSETCGCVVGDHEWGHLQLDAVSLYLLTLAQVTTSGIRVIWTVEEVAFIQNLIFYIELTYRIPDYGIWERGDKTNHGQPELNSSSVGMAKAALEAMNELDLFGAHGGPHSTIHVIIDESHQCGTVLESMLPRESYSKETDAALLGVISFPAFAVDNDELIEKTRQTIVTKLQGRYGCKRFLRDGFRTAREDPNRLHYEPWELRAFENIECEWPIFYCFLVLDAQFRDDFSTARMYLDKLYKLILMRRRGSTENATNDMHSYCLAEKFPVVPESYQVIAENVEKEKAQPGSQPRIAVGRCPHLSAQSLYLLGRMIDDELLLPGEVDPLGRRMVTEPKPDLVIQICCIAENEIVQKRLVQYGIHVMTHKEIMEHNKIRVYPAKVLTQLYKYLGVCPSLRLKGRASKEVGVLTTSRLYTFGDHTLVFTPQFIDYQSFYMSLDVYFALDILHNALAFLRVAWNSPGRPLLILPIFERHLAEPTTASYQSHPAMVTTLKRLESGFINGTRVILGKLNSFINTSCTTKMSFLQTTVWEKLREEEKASTSHKETILANIVDEIINAVAAKRNAFTMDGVSTIYDSSKCPTPIHSRSRKESLEHDRDTQMSGTSSPYNSLKNRHVDPLVFRHMSVLLRRKSMALSSALSEDLQTRASCTASFTVADDEEEVHPSVLKGSEIYNRDLHRVKEEGGYGSPLLSPASDRIDSDSLHVRRLMTTHSSLNHLASKQGTPTSRSEVFNQTPSLENGLNDINGEENEWENFVGSASPDVLVEQLSKTESMYEQIDLLHTLYSKCGMEWDTGLGQGGAKCTIRDLLREVYNRAGHSLQWMALRFTAGMLRKRPDILARAITDILVRQKQVTVGLPPEPREKIITRPLPPEQLSALIHEACGEDYCMAMMTHEILVYLSMICQTEAQLLRSMLRLRVGLIIQVMASELGRSMRLSPEEAAMQLYSLSPYECKTLLHHTLSGREFHVDPESQQQQPVDVLQELQMEAFQVPLPKPEMVQRRRASLGKALFKRKASRPVLVDRNTIFDASHPMSGLIVSPGPVSPEEANYTTEEETETTALKKNSSPGGNSDKRGQWLRRRKIDGALNRVPPNFYDGVWLLLERCQTINIGGGCLHQNLTKEMTDGEFKFALTVEGCINRVQVPEYRQLLMEALTVFCVFVKYFDKSNTRLNLREVNICVDDIVRKAHQIFLEDQMNYHGDATLCCAPPSQVNGQEGDAGRSMPYPSPCEGANNICIHFYDTAPSGVYGTMTYIARAIAQTIWLPLNADSELQLDHCAMQ